mmetsp:Transcript_50754/g.91128  ORF Transcript_50754/g.91128 Transcript_50754/m.91128 type:complete len:233 (-) Transcript_50754:185-883(-)|eukprot:CAMPEP_0197658196 /NCGR_PEP_ID=MMETSP1338-20131121/45095_1 /TAXON_ID=43686 ORGANISM="Pelagodinium beii, Strain RCC1491" /NCGR_SAMPLE_ID=MMETSP1338 /ASSEMBLY_ACC=CAM_ASM_000754 /LENGTH=232 /DNA_ID=CAMNT_0043234741 /DNA_START=92 /DNA_END=790 /DNA_ORIENTATION=-
MGRPKAIVTVKHTFLHVEFPDTPERRRDSAPAALHNIKLNNPDDVWKPSIEASTPDKTDEQARVSSTEQETTGGDPGPANGRTTVMLRNVPSTYTRAMLMNLLDTEGFAGTYDFLYLPIHFSSNSGFGYAFINFVNTEVTVQFWAHFDNFTRWGIESDKVAEVTWSWKHQGLAEHVERYRNSPVVHDSMPDECKPIILENGVRVPFPPPTKRVQQPRLRAKESKAASRETKI